jgi:glycine/D-amino acid oxidase-like deaminating enzyme/nitrite reductase/ring-hydroxylating ferredoxin subunit
MNTDNGRTRSVWMATADTGIQPELHEDVSADVCVIGGGIAGITTAYLLARERKSVVLLDDGPLAGGETSRTSAHLVFYNDDGLTTIERLHGTEGLRVATDSHKAAVNRIFEIAGAEHIDCDLKRVDGYLFVSPDGQQHDFLDKELDAAHRIGLKEAHWVDRAPLPGFDTGRCLCYPQQGQFHPLKYLAGVLKAFWKRGGRVYGHTHADKVESDGTTARVTTRGGPVVTAGSVVVTTNSPVNDRVAIHTKQSAWRTYILGFRIPKDSVPLGLYWDTEDPYHYVRVQQAGDHDVLIVGGEDHKTGQANDPDVRYGNLEKWARPRFPMARDVEFHWSGQVLEPFDCLSFTGRNPLDAPNVYVHTGDSGMGLTHGTIAGILLTDLIVGRPNSWANLYDPSRVTLKGLSTWVKDNVTVAAQYTDLLTPGDVAGESEIAPRTGAVIRRGATKVAVYRDEHDALHECSAICPHLGCVVKWNHAESSWDCPCHGSRFDPYGKVVNGPANEDLQRVERASENESAAIKPVTA